MFLLKITEVRPLNPTKRGGAIRAPHPRSVGLRDSTSVVFISHQYFEIFLFWAPKAGLIRVSGRKSENKIHQAF